MWNLNQGGKLENLKGNAEESSVCSRCHWSLMEGQGEK
jgi:hypothetical protein